MKKRKTRSVNPSKQSAPTDPIDLVMELMAIPGPSGKESQVADYVRSALVKAGANSSQIRTDSAHRRTPIDGELGNLIFKIPGTVRGPRRLLMSHLDTVPICVGCRPIRRGKYVQSADSDTGLGADNRAGVAVTLLTALRLLKEKPAHPPLTFLWTVQEEIGLHGARQVTRSLLGKPQYAFNWDGGSPTKLTIGATGGYRMSIAIRGLASHAGNAPEKGISAIAIASLAIADLQANGWHGLVEKGGKRGTVNVGVIRGGNATNVVTDLVELRAEVRSHDPKFRQRIIREVTKAFEKAVKNVKSASGQTGSVKFDGRLDYEAFRLDPSEVCVETAKKAVEAVGGTAEVRVTNGGIDANWLVAYGIPTTTLGCGQMNPHTVKEQLNISEFETACKIAWQLATADATIATQ